MSLPRASSVVIENVILVPFNPDEREPIPATSAYLVKLFSDIAKRGQDAIVGLTPSLILFSERRQGAVSKDDCIFNRIRYQMLKIEQDSSRINYVYFGLFYLGLVLLSLSSIFAKENQGGSHLFFFLYALGQATLEILLLTLLSLLIPRYFSPRFFALFIGLTFVLFVIHILDFLMNRILDLSALDAFRIFVWDENIQNFFYLLDASGISLWVWSFFFLFLASLPLIGILVYHASDLLSQKKPLLIKKGSVLQACVCIPLGLLFWDFSASKAIHPDAYTAFIKALPWKVTFLPPESIFLATPGPLREPLPADRISESINQDRTVLSEKPNIYLFVTESLREDAITADIAPHLFEFKNSSLHLERAFSGGNGTHLSWFSIFHSEFPYHWKLFQTSRCEGSPSLRLLKKWGYQLRLYSSAELGYYGMDKVLFGDRLQLLDQREEFHDPSISAAESDLAALLKLQSDLASRPELRKGQIFLIFWDSTHFDYRLPKTWSPKFTPYAQEFACFKAFHSQKTIRSIKNRYHNAVNFMDHLFGRFLANLPDADEAIVVFTGDHGEEFFEHGHLFHNSHLTREQTHVPLYMKLGNKPPQELAIGSHMDIFPTLIDFLSGSAPTYLEGTSLFRKQAWPYALTARFNAGRAPYQFALHNGKNKLIAEFQKKTQVFEHPQIKIISIRTEADQSVNEENTEEWIEQEFGPAIQKIFISKILQPPL